MAHEATTKRFPPLIRLKSETGTETVYYSVVYEGLPDEFRCVAQKELNETEEKRKHEMQRLKELVKRENLGNLHDNYILAVLRTCKYNPKKSEARLRKFAAAYQEIVNMAVNLDLSKAEKILDDMGFGIVPYRDKHGRFVAYSRPYGLRLDEYSLDDVASCVFSTVLFLMAFPITSVTGLSFVGECEMPSLSLFYPLFRGFMKYLPTFFLLPIRVKRLDILNQMPLFYWAFKIASTIIPDKITRRLSFHGSKLDKLHKAYDPRILPDYFGGTFGPNSSHIYKEGALEFIRELKIKHHQSISPNN